MPNLILASTSRYRAELLGRLGLPFETRAPKVDETPEPGELPAALAARLARAKAEAVAASVEDTSTVVVGSDQVPSLEADILTKPGTRANTVAQLAACVNKTVVFYTAVSVIDCGSGRSWHVVDVTEVEFGNLTLTQIERYVERERSYDCAGGFKAEGLGIVLFKAIRSNDPTALIGLPLIWLADMLRRAGLDPLAPPAPSATTGPFASLDLSIRPDDSAQ